MFTLARSPASSKAWKHSLALVKERNEESRHHMQVEKKQTVERNCCTKLEKHLVIDLKEKSHIQRAAIPNMHCAHGMGMPEMVQTNKGTIACTDQTHDCIMKMAAGTKLDHILLQ